MGSQVSQKIAICENIIVNIDASIALLQCYTLKQLANSGSSSSVSVAIIGGAVGGVILLLMIIVVLCIVILCMRRSCMKEDNKVTYSTTKPNKDVTVDYNVTKPNRINHLYFKIKQGDSDALIATSPAYSIPIKHHSKASEDECDYVQPNEFMQHSDLEDAIYISPQYNCNTF